MSLLCWRFLWESHYHALTLPKAISGGEKLEIGKLSVHVRSINLKSYPAMLMLGENGVVLVKTEEEFISAMTKAQGKALWDAL